ncbi:hypothetical protein Cgig2_024042 [Carnegiea gigantea]|uniref:Uncharacterized protein n=1 Tax=Carnegiea gigantea TaxID=171969 RepID=A0A9Q1QJ25_9CARY|nr:hypothetical protein Cgig2_024042 [Carnegiea gigantea]
MVKLGFGIIRVMKSCLCKIGDRYQMIDLHRDAYVEGKKCGVDVPEYFGFAFCPPGSKKKLPLESDKDWRNLVSIWEYDGGKIPICMLALSTPTMYTFIVQQLQSSQVGPTEKHVEPLTLLLMRPLSFIHHDPESAKHKSQLPKLAVDLSAYLSSQPRSTSQLELPSLDANVGLGGLEAYDLRDLCHPRRVSNYDYNGECWEGSSGEMNDSDSDNSLDVDFDAEDLEEASEEEECNESLVHSDENDSNDGSDADDLLNVDLENEIPGHIDADAEDKDGNSIENVWNKMYQNGNMWARNSDGKVSIAEGDMFVDKDQWSKKLIMERYGVALPRHTCDRAKKFLNSWVDGAKLHLLFWTTYNGYNKHVHNQAIEAIKKESVAAYDWLLGETVEHWARYTFPVHLKCPDNTTNFVESFNGKIELFRYKPVFTLLEEIRRKFMKTIANRFKVAKSWPGHVVPRVKMIITKTKLESRGCIITLASRDPIFWKERECPKLGPPLVQFKRGRPPSERRRDITEKRKVYTKSNTLRCSKCKQFGHNSRSHRESNVLEIRRGKDKPRKPKVGDKRRVGRPSKVDENTSKKAKTIQGASSQPTIATASTSQPKKPRTSSS